MRMLSQAVVLAALFTAAPLHAQDSLFTASTFRGLTLREIGPAVTSGRIADFAVSPTDPATWYVASASGGVWKTVNDGTTFEPVFGVEGSYSIGVVTLDPGNPHVIWVGTGENNAAETGDSTGRRTAARRGPASSTWTRTRASTRS